MFQFPTFALQPYVFRLQWPYGRVSPFRYPRINAYSQLPAAFRSVLRLSSPLIAKASTKCPYLSLDSYNISISLFAFTNIFSTKNLFYPWFFRIMFWCISLYFFLPRFFDNTIFSYHTIQLLPYLQCFITIQEDIIGGGKENVIPNCVGHLSSYLTSISLRSSSVRCDSELLSSLLSALPSLLLVEVRRIELLTPCLQSRCSPSWAIPPMSTNSPLSETF